MSQTGLCPDCGKERVGENVEQMAARSGPNFQRWRRAMAACVGAALLDESPSGAQTGDHAG